MLYLDITGHKAPRRRCEDAVAWFIGNHHPKHKLEIIVHHRGLLREGVYGWCSVLDCDARPRSFLLEIHNRLDPKAYLKTLFHELVHVHQHVRGDLRDKGPLRLWKGVDCSELDYDDLPWELEAQAMEDSLYHEYLTRVQ
jgi:hypothetical protein